MKNIWVLVPFLAIQMLSGCKAYKRDIMLQFDDRFDASAVEKSVERVAGNYIIQPGDYLELILFTNDGERIIDPNNELGGSSGQSQNNQRRNIAYLVMENGTCRLPIVGVISLQNLTVNQAEELLQESFNDFYQDSYVKLTVSNRRAILLGGVSSGVSGTGGQVVNLVNENITILEVIALAGGVSPGSKVSSIKLIRGELANPKVYEIDLHTIAGMKQSAMIVEPNDVIYIEPWRRPWKDTMRDITPVMTFITSSLTFIYILQN